MIFAEDLNCGRQSSQSQLFEKLGTDDLKAMSRGMLCKHILDAGFGQFLNILEWVCSKRDVFFAKVDANFTSQICPNCQTHTGKKELKERIHECLECGYTTDRDVAAAQVVVQRGITAVGHIAVKQASGKDISLPAMQESPDFTRDFRGKIPPKLSVTIRRHFAGE